MAFLKIKNVNFSLLNYEKFKIKAEEIINLQNYHL